MKKILFNGCSYVAGDAIVWDEYIKEYNRPDRLWNKFVIGGKFAETQESRSFVDYYRDTYRRSKNLPALLSNKLGAEWIDISEDGNSNDSIALTTILALLNIPESERVNYHVVIGWTSLSRALKFSTRAQAYFNAHASHVGINDEIVNELKRFIKVNLIEGYDQDHVLNYIKNVIMLESFLRDNKCSYTFYRSLGTGSDSTMENLLWPINPHFSILSTPTDIHTLSNNANWFKFLNVNPPILGDSLCSEYLDREGELMYENWVTEDNGHPNLKVITELSSRLADFIKSQGAGF